jgi:PAS domain S-box-containing protein
MKNKIDMLTDANTLRQKAEELLKKIRKGPHASSPETEADMLKLIHELEVHQVELEMLNEELIVANERIEDLANEKYKELYDFAPSAYLSLSKIGEILELNFVAANMLGKERSKLIKKRFDFYVSIETQVIFNLFLENAFTTNTKQNCEVIIQTEGNLPIYVYIDGIVNQDNEICLLNIVDITERKWAVEEIKRTGQHYQSLIEKASDGIVLIDEKGNFKYVSPLAKKMFGYLQTDEIFAHPSEYTHPDDLQRVLSELEKILVDPAYIPTLEYRFIDKLGQWQWVETTFSNLLANPNVESIVLNFHDITDRKHTEEKLIKSEERYALVIKASEQGIWDWNVETNEVFYSEQWKKQIGYNDDELKNEFNTWVEHLHPDEKEYCQNAVNSYLEQAVEHFIIDFRFRHKDGTYRWIHNKAASLKNKEGKVIRLFGTHTDITESKLSEAIFKDIIEKIQCQFRYWIPKGFRFR